MERSSHTTSTYWLGAGGARRNCAVATPCARWLSPSLPRLWSCETCAVATCEGTLLEEDPEICATRGAEKLGGRDFRDSGAPGARGRSASGQLHARRREMHSQVKSGRRGSRGSLWRETHNSPRQREGERGEGMNFGDLFFGPQPRLGKSPRKFSLQARADCCDCVPRFPVRPKTVCSTRWCSRVALQVDSRRKELVQMTSAHRSH